MQHWDNLYWLLGEKPPGHFAMPGQPVVRPTDKEAWSNLVRSDACLAACREAVETEDLATLAAVWEQLQHPSLPDKIESLYAEQRDGTFSNYQDLPVENLLDTLRAAVVASRLAVAARQMDIDALKTLPARLVQLLGDGASLRQTAELPDWFAGTDPVQIADDCLKRQMASSTRPVAAARDMVRTLLCAPRSAVSPTARVPVLYFDPLETGEVLFLELELLGDGTGELFAEPFEMGLWPTRNDWLKSLQSAWQAAQQIARHPRVDVDIRWKLSGLGHVKEGWPKMIEGGSAAAMAAVSLAQLLDDAPVEDRITLTATIDDESKRLGRVGGVFHKVEAALKKMTTDQSRAVTRIVVHPDNVDEAREAARTCGYSPTETIATARDLDEAMVGLRRHSQQEWPDINLCPPSPPADFVGRANIIQAVRQHVNQHSGYLVLVGGMGCGKTSLMQRLIQLAHREGQQPVFHLVGQHSFTIKARGIAAALYQRLLYKYRQHIKSPPDDWREQDEPARLERLLERISNTVLQEQAEREVIYIDASDEIEGRLIGDILPRVLPVGFRCVISSRREQRGAKTTIHWDLDEYFQDRADIREYLRHPDSPLNREFVEQIVSHTPNPPVFVTVSTLMRRAREADVSFDKERAELLTNPQPWLQPATELFRQEWERAADLADDEYDISSTSFAEILGHLALAKQLLSREQLQALGLWDVETERVLKLARSFFKRYDRQDPQARFEFDHGGFREEILSRLSDTDRMNCHQRLADGCLRWKELDDNSRRYALAYLTHHLIHARQWEQCEQLLCGLESLPFLEAKAEAGMALGLADDYREAAIRMPYERVHAKWLLLFEEALRRDIHFIRQHPETLFQCLWNSCWWHDCPDVEAHYETPETGWLDDVPWKAPGPKLYELLEQWKECKEHQLPSFRWLRSLRPPAMALGSYLQATFVGHTAGIRKLAMLPDGNLVASASEDNTIRVWNLDGHQTACLKGHDGTVENVAFRPDGYLVSSSKDRTVCVWDVESGEALGRHGAAPVLSSMEISADGHRVAVAGGSSSVRIWLPQEGRLQEAIDVGEDALVRLSDSGKYLAAAVGDTITVWNLDTHDLVARFGSNADVICVAFSTSGEHIAVGTVSGSVCIWDVAGTTMVKRFKAHSQPVTCIVYESTGSYFATSAERRVSVWEEDYESSLFDLEVYKEQVSDDEISSLCFLNRSGPPHLLVGTTTGEVLIVDLLRADCVKGVLAGVEPDADFVATRDDAVSHNPVEIIAASRDGRAFAVFAGAGHWVLATPDTPSVHRIMERSRVCGMRFSNDGDQLRVGFSDGRIETWDTSTDEKNAEIMHVGATRSDLFLATVFDQDARRFASTSGARLVQIWDTLTGEELVRIRDMEGEPTTLMFSPDGQLVSCAFPDGAIRLWDTLGGEMLHSLPAQNKEVLGLWFPGIPDHLLVHYNGEFSEGGILRLWNFREERIVNCWCNDCENVSVVSLDTAAIRLAVASRGSILIGNIPSATHETKLQPDCAIGIQWIPETPFLVTWEGKDIHVWNLKHGTLHAQFVGHSKEITDCLALSEDGQLVSGSADGTIHQFDIRRSAPRRLLAGSSPIRVISMSHDGSEVAVGHGNGQIYRWDASRGKTESVLNGHKSPVRALAYCRSKRLLVSGSRDWTVRLWDLTQNSEICCFRGHQGHVLAVACADDGSRVASTSAREPMIRVWNPKDPKDSATLEGHWGEIRALAISRDGKLLVSGSEDRTIRIWNLDDGQEIYCFDSLDPWTTAVAFAADGKRIVTGFYDERTRIFDLGTGRCVERMEGHGQVHEVAEDLSLRTRRHHHSIAVVSEDRKEPAAIWPASHGEMTNLITHKAGRIWASVVLDNLVLLQLEGKVGQSGGFTS